MITRNQKINYDTIIEKGDILYIEVLPIILTDFLQENNDFDVIDLDADDAKFLSDIKIKLDDNPMKKMNIEKNSNIFMNFFSNKNNISNNNEKMNLNLSQEEQ